MHSHIRCTCSTFLCCVLLNVCSKRLHKRMQIHIGCICLNLTHCAFANVLSKHIHKNIFNYTHCICLTFLDCALPFVLLNVWEYENELEKSQHNIVILSVESYSCHSYHHCHCHHNRHRCCHRHRHLHCHQYKHCCVIFIESWYFALIFIRYLEDQWISGPHPPYTWNCFGRVEDGTFYLKIVGQISIATTWKHCNNLYYFPHVIIYHYPCYLFNHIFNYLNCLASKSHIIFLI